MHCSQMRGITRHLAFRLRRTAVHVEPAQRILAKVSPAGGSRPPAPVIGRCVLRALLATARVTLQGQVWSSRGER